MKSRLKRVTGLGLGLVLTSGALAACGAPETETPSDPAAEAVEHAVAAQGEGGEGEAGVSTADAATNAVVYNTALAIAAAHVLAAQGAFEAGETQAAAEMLAHPVSEVLLDLEPSLIELGVTPFASLFTEASGAILDGESPERIEARMQTLLLTISAASDQGPDDGSTPEEIAARVAVDQIDRASDMYRIAQEAGAYGPYLDGYGFFQAGVLAFSHQSDAIRANDPAAAEHIETALALLADAYPSVLMPDGLDADRAALSSASAQAMLAVLN